MVKKVPDESLKKMGTAGRSYKGSWLEGLWTGKRSSSAEAAGSDMGKRRSAGAYPGAQGMWYRRERAGAYPGAGAGSVTPKAPKTSSGTGSTTGSITKPSKSYSDSRSQLGDFYLNATKDMDLWNEKKKK